MTIRKLETHRDQIRQQSIELLERGLEKLRQDEYSEVLLVLISSTDAETIHSGTLNVFESLGYLERAKMGLLEAIES